MDAYVSIAILVIAILCKRNYELSRVIKKESYLLHNLNRLIEKNEELTNANQNLATEVKRQQQLNYDITNSYNDLQDSVIDMPPKSGRFFAITLSNNHTLKHFSEN